MAKKLISVFAVMVLALCTFVTSALAKGVSDWTPFDASAGVKTQIAQTSEGIQLTGAGEFTNGGSGAGAQYNTKVDIKNFNLEYSVDQFSGLLGVDAGAGHFIVFGFQDATGGIGSGNGFYISQYQGPNDTTLITYQTTQGVTANKLVSHLNLPNSSSTTKPFKISIACDDSSKIVEVRFNGSFRFQNKEKNMEEYVFKIAYSELNIDALKNACYFSIQSQSVDASNKITSSKPMKITVAKLNGTAMGTTSVSTSSTATSSKPASSSSSVKSSQAPATVSSAVSSNTSSLASSVASSEVSTEETGSINSSSTASGSTDKSGFPVWIVIVIAAIVLAGGGSAVYFFIIKKKKA